MHMISVHAFRPEMRSRTCRNLARLGVDWLDFKAGKPPLRRAQLIDIGRKAQTLRGAIGVEGQSVSVHHFPEMMN